MDPKAQTPTARASSVQSVQDLRVDGLNQRHPCHLIRGTGRCKRLHLGSNNAQPTSCTTERDNTWIQILSNPEPEKGSLTLDPLSFHPTLTNCSLKMHSMEETPLLTDCLEELLKANSLRDYREGGIKRTPL